jgi:hypothetical protein
MLVHNVRLGFATNSSSSHSIIFLKPKQRVEDSDVEGGEFGWNYFTAASAEAKRQYVAIHLFHALANQVNADVAEAVVDSWVKGYEKSDETNRHECGVEPRGYVDHQSVYVLPCSWEGKGVDKQFFQEFSNFFLRDDVVILGGNDNDDTSHPLDDGSFVLPLPRDGAQGQLVARKDEKGNYWTIFDRGDGTKIRFSFDKPNTKREVTKASVPELVDLKITDHCPFGCDFCYQGSTHEGKHADASLLNTLAFILGRDMHVFEVAIGGGEPTLHPKFVEILSSFRHYGVVPNFTTKNLAWLRDPAVWPKVMENIGGFAYSVEKVEDVKKLATLLELNNIDPRMASVQYVMGVSSLYELEAIIRAAAEARLRVTLLGYKITGRGASFKPEPYKGWLKMVEKLRDKEHVYVNLGIDTALAQQSTKELADSKVHPKLYATQEGMFSMYIDAVESKLAASSYVPDVAMRRVKQIDHQTILDTFAGYKKTSFERVVDSLPE